MGRQDLLGSLDLGERMASVARTECPEQPVPQDKTEHLDNKE